MSQSDYVIWFVVTTVAFMTLMVLGIAGAADRLPHPLRRLASRRGRHTGAAPGARRLRHH